MKKSMIAILVILVLSIGGYFAIKQTGKTNSPLSTIQQTTVAPSTPNSAFDKNDNLDSALQDLQTVDKNSQ